LEPTPPAPDPPPAAVCAPLEAEPLPPEGVNADALYAAILAALGVEKGTAWLQWHESDWPRWGRGGWRRLEKGQKNCSPAK